LGGGRIRLMRRLLRSLAPVLQLTRVTSAFAAVANVWFVVLWTLHHGAREPGSLRLGETPLSVLLTGGAATALGLYAFGAAVNDVLDLKRDRTLSPHRPLPAGEVSLELALFVVVAMVLIAVLGATAFGLSGVLLTLLVATAVLAFNVVGRFIPGMGLVLLGLIYAGHMLVPNVELRFLWPVWLVMTHALAVAGIVHVVGRKVPRLSARAVAAAIAGWGFWSGVLVVVAMWRGGEASGLWPEWVSPTILIGPGLLVGGYVAVAIHRTRRHGPGPRAAEKIGRYGALWPALYAIAWLVGVGAWRGVLILGALTAVGVLGMTILRELYGLAEQPPGYRR